MNLKITAIILIQVFLCLDLGWAANRAEQSALSPRISIEGVENNFAEIYALRENAGALDISRVIEDMIEKLLEGIFLAIQNDAFYHRDLAIILLNRIKDNFDDEWETSSVKKKIDAIDEEALLRIGELIAAPVGRNKKRDELLKILQMPRLAGQEKKKIAQAIAGTIGIMGREEEFFVESLSRHCEQEDKYELRVIYAKLCKVLTYHFRNGYYKWQKFRVTPEAEIKREIKLLLRKYGIAQDLRIVEEIFKTLDVQPGDTWLEVGPGYSVLSLLAALCGAEVTLIERDGDAAVIQENLWQLLKPAIEAAGGKFEIIHGDINKSGDKQIEALLKDGYFKYVVCLGVIAEKTTAKVVGLAGSDARTGSKLLSTLARVKSRYGGAIYFSKGGERQINVEVSEKEGIKTAGIPDYAEIEEAMHENGIGEHAEGMAMPILTYPLPLKLAKIYKFPAEKVKLPDNNESKEITDAVVRIFEERLGRGAALDYLKKVIDRHKVVFLEGKPRPDEILDNEELPVALANAATLVTYLKDTAGRIKEIEFARVYASMENLKQDKDITSYLALVHELVELDVVNKIIQLKSIEGSKGQDLTNKGYTDLMTWLFVTRYTEDFRLTDREYFTVAFRSMFDICNMFLTETGQQKVSQVMAILGDSELEKEFEIVCNRLAQIIISPENERKKLIRIFEKYQTRHINEYSPQDLKIVKEWFKKLFEQNTADFLLLNMAGTRSEEAAKGEESKTEGFILVVDDDKKYRDIYAGLLGQWGYKIVLAKSGEAAWEIFQKNHAKFSCIITDLDMGEMSGEDLIKEIRRVDNRIKIMVISSRKCAFEEGINYYLHKGDEFSEKRPEPLLSGLAVSLNIKPASGREVPQDERKLFLIANNIINGRIIADEISADLKTWVETFKQVRGFAPKLVIITTDASESSLAQRKRRACEAVGIEVEVIPVAAAARGKEILDVIKKCNEDSSIHGILVQLPLQNVSEEDERIILDAVSFTKDIDGQGSVIVEAITKGNFSPYFTPVPVAVLEILDRTGTGFANKNVVLLGDLGTNDAKTTARVLKTLFETRGVRSVEIIEPENDFRKITREADILVSFVNNPDKTKITTDDVKEGAVVIDLGWAADSSGKTGDVDAESVKKKNVLLSPAVGGFGPICIQLVAANTLRAATYLWGEPLAQDMRNNTREKVNRLEERGITPTIALLAGNDSGAQWYKGQIVKEAEKVGIHCEDISIEGYTQAEVEALIDKLNRNPFINGILPLTNLPEGIDLNDIANRISLEKDVDGMNLPPLFDVKKEESASSIPDAIITAIKTKLSEKGLSNQGIGVGIIGRNKWALPLALRFLQIREAFSSVRLIDPDADFDKAKGEEISIDFSDIGKKTILLEVAGETFTLDISNLEDNVDLLLKKAPLLDPESGRKASNTPEAAIKMLESATSIKGKHILVIGRRKEGLPLALRLFALGAGSVEIAHSQTMDLKKKILASEVVISTVNVPAVITDMVSPGAIVIDITTTYVDKLKIFDAKPKKTGSTIESTLDNAAAVTPVPFGVGSVTTPQLLATLVNLAEKQINDIENDPELINRVRGMFSDFSGAFPLDEDRFAQSFFSEEDLAAQEEELLRRRSGGDIEEMLKEMEDFFTKLEEELKNLYGENWQQVIEEEIKRMKRAPYEILGIEPTASDEEVKQAFRKAIKELALQTGYSLLSDEERKAKEERAIQIYAARELIEKSRKNRQKNKGIPSLALESKNESAVLLVEQAI